MKYAEIIVDVTAEALDRPFTYRIPAALAAQIACGTQVVVPFGKGDRMVRGFVIHLTDKAQLPAGKIKDIAAVATDGETVEEKLIGLAVWMSHTYGGVLAQSLKTVFPARRKIAAKETRIVSLTKGQDLAAYRAALKKNQAVRARVLDLLEAGDGIPAKEVEARVPVSPSVLQAMARDGVITIEATQHLRSVTEGVAVKEKEKCSKEQTAAVSTILKEWETKDRPVLINGVTGSGKTLVYMELIEKVLSEGKQVIVLIPEIALTRQTVARFVARFGEAVSFMHSRLSTGERYDQMKAAKQGSIAVMVGPRSALFAPFSKLGLIIIDEEQESTYHSESTPRYHACETAIERARREGAHVVFGSATPSLWASAMAARGDFALVRLRERYGKALLPAVQLVDLREVRKEGGNDILSPALASAVEDCLQKGEQVMLFLNRRGYAGGVSCRACGQAVKCPHCDVALTMHQNGRLVCHYCGHEEAMPDVCPVCGAPHVSGVSVGTQQVERICRERFPKARILRMDMDSTRGKEGHAAILAAFEKKEADILIGTQMIVKGHDFGNVTLVGILLADMSLMAADFWAAERTYQLIVQAIGRAGRADKPGRAIIQAWQCDHPAILAAAKQDYDAFFAEELSYRKLMHYPPEGELLAVLAAGPSEKHLSEAMHYLRQFIDKIDPSQQMRAIGPAPQSVGKVRDAYRQVIYLRHAKREVLIAAKDRMEAYIKANKGFQSLRIEFDLHA